MKTFSLDFLRIINMFHLELESLSSTSANSCICRTECISTMYVGNKLCAKNQQHCIQTQVLRFSHLPAVVHDVGSGARTTDWFLLTTKTISVFRVSQNDANWV